MKKNTLFKSFLILFTFLFSVNTIAQNVNVIENLYSESGDGTLYRNTTYEVNTTDINDLAAYTIGADIELLNIYYDDGIDNGTDRYDLHGVSGKNVKSNF